MNEEITIAIDELRAGPSDTTWFIPILLNATDIPSRSISSVEDLKDINFVNLYEDWNGGIRRILKVIRYDDPVLARIWYLTDIIDGPFDDERLHAIRQLANTGLVEERSIASLISATKAQSPEIRKASWKALEKIHPGLVVTFVPKVPI